MLKICRKHPIACESQEKIGFSFFVFFGLYLILYSPTFIPTESGLIKPLVAIGLFIATLKILVRDGCDGSSIFRIDLSKVINFGHHTTVIPVLVVSYWILALMVSQLIAFLGGGDEVLIQLIGDSITALIPLTYLMVCYIPKGSNPLKSIIAMTALVGGLQALFIILDISSSSARDIFASIVKHPNGITGTFRAAGLTSITGDGLSFSQCICGLCAFYLLLKSKDNLNRFIWSILYLLIFFSLFPVARTGIVILSFFSAVLFIFSEAGFILRLKSIIFLLALSFLMIILLFNLLSFIAPERLIFLTDTLLPYAFEFVFNYLEGNGFATNSTDDILKNMVIFPDNIISWIIGDGYFYDPNNALYNYNDTDIGYLRILFYTGLAGSFLLYFWYFLVAYFCVHSKENKNYRIIIMVIISAIMVANLKFPFVLQSTAICLGLLLLFSCQCKKYTKWSD